MAGTMLRLLAASACFYFVCLQHGTDAAKFLFFNGMGEGSHFTTAAVIGKELAARNHSVTFLISNAFLFRTEDPLYSKIFTFEVFQHTLPLDTVRNRMTGLTEAAFEDRLWSYMVGNNNFTEDGRQDIADIMGDKEMIDRLLAADFDLVFYDPSWAFAAILADMLGSPYVALSPPAFLSAHYRFFGGQSNPAIIPELGSGLPLRMSFQQRLWNVAWGWFNDIFMRLHLDEPYKNLQCVPKAQRDKGAIGAFRDTSLWFINSDPVIDIPAPLTPNIIAVPGLTTRPANPLEQDLETFVRAAGDSGVIVFSLGSYVSHMPPEKIDVFVGAFGKLKQNIIWQWKAANPPENLPPNIRTMKWIPQNDLLGHNSTRLFIYQGGNNGLYEAIYHAVPLLVLPILGDQYDVAQRVDERGIGKRLNVLTLTSETLLDSINEVIATPSYQLKIDAMSRIFRDKPQSSVELVAFWVEHVIKFGADHLRSPVHDLSFIELYMLDVYLVLGVAASLVGYILYRIMRFFVCCCISPCRKGKSKED